MNRGSLSAGLLLLLAAIIPGAHGQVPDTPSRRFAEANALYQNGEFSRAEALYRDLVQSGVESGALFFNLGNTCFKQKRLGEAIYFWEKALQKNPRDREVRENLEFANLLVVDRIEVPPEPMPIRLLDRTVHFLTVPQESYLVLALFALANVLAGTYFIARSARARIIYLTVTLASVTLLLLFGSSLVWKVYEQQNQKHGIVVEQKVDIRSGPGTQNVTVFTIHEGSKVRVRSEASGWFLVSLANGWTGWVEKSAILVL